MIEECPHCGISLRGPEIPEEYLRKGYYGEWDGKSKRYYSRVIGIEIPEVYDGTLYWQCPACEGKWHRFPEGHYLHVRAQPFV